MTQAVRWILVTIFAMLALATYTGAAPAAESEVGPDTVRFEVASIKAVRPLLVGTLSAIQQGDVARAKEIFDGYDSAWNGIEVYINVRSKTLYEVLELDLQAKITKALDARDILAQFLDHAGDHGLHPRGRPLASQLAAEGIEQQLLLASLASRN
jgi:hypothetical protein